MSHSLTADQHKQLGNEHFKNREYEEAITEYTRAIVKDPKHAVYYTNRANCYLKLDKFQNVINDCERALEFDPKSLKAYYFMGKAQVELLLPYEALASLKKAYDFAQEQRSGFVKEIVGLILEAKKQRWIEMERVRIAEVSETYRYMKGLIDEDFKRRASSLDKESPYYTEEVIALGQEKEERLRQLDRMLQRAGEPDEYAAPYLKRSTGISKPEQDDDHGAFKPANVSQDEAMSTPRSDATLMSTPKTDAMDRDDDSIKENVKWPRKNLAPRVVPDYFLDKIMFEFMHDPVISAKSGISYERKMILEHFSYGRMFDPIAQVPMTERDLIPNRALKEACDAYLAENGWAVDY
ncbi:STIP1 y and U box-containing protein 1 [Actinomortierella ambigua]|nr:STIP1 y and U box-containing protein 1 [Actinomortierella ambigua]